jgi:hypothetical protein
VDGHRIKAPLEYSRGLEKTWISGALRVRDGKELILLWRFLKDGLCSEHQTRP